MLYRSNMSDKGLASFILLFSNSVTPVKFVKSFHALNNFIVNISCYLPLHNFSHSALGRLTGFPLVGLVSSTFIIFSLALADNFTSDNLGFTILFHLSSFVPSLSGLGKTFSHIFSSYSFVKVGLLSKPNFVCVNYICYNCLFN